MAHQNVLRPKFAIYRKTTFFGVSINGRSFHPQRHQFATITSAIPMNVEAFEDEVNQIENIALINSLKVNVRKLVKRKRLRQLLAETRSHPLLQPPIYKTKMAPPTLLVTSCRTIG